MNRLDTPTSSLNPQFTIPQALLEKLMALPRREDVVLRFVDYDGTLMDDEVRFLIDPEMRNHRKDAAIYYINKNFSTERDPTGFKKFVALLNPKNHIFANTGVFFDPNNPHDFILSAGNIVYQKEKIHQSGFPDGTNVLIVLKAQTKPIVMLLTCLRLGFIPGRIEFYDNNIDDFQSIDSTLSLALGGIPVDFYRVSATMKRSRLAKLAKTRSTARVQKITQNSISGLLK